MVMLLEIVGRRIEIEENEEYATRIENGDHLILWNSNLLDDLWVDKYDVRMLCHNSQNFSVGQEKNTSLVSYDDKEVEEEEMMLERYQDLKKITEEQIFPNLQQNQPTLQKEEVPYQWPDFLTLPSNVDIPRTQKSFNLIAHTTKSTRVIPQLEVLLRVKQSANPAFSFLFPGDILHPFYQVT